MSLIKSIFVLFMMLLSIRGFAEPLKAKDLADEKRWIESLMDILTEDDTKPDSAVDPKTIDEQAVPIYRKLVQLSVRKGNKGKTAFSRTDALVLARFLVDMSFAHPQLMKSDGDIIKPLEALKAWNDLMASCKNIDDHLPTEIYVPLEKRGSLLPDLQALKDLGFDEGIREKEICEVKYLSQMPDVTD